MWVVVRVVVEALFENLSCFSEELDDLPLFGLSPEGRQDVKAALATCPLFRSQAGPEVTPST